MNIYRLGNGVYVRTYADLSPSLGATRVNPDDAEEMRRAREYFRACGLSDR